MPYSRSFSATARDFGGFIFASFYLHLAWIELLQTKKRQVFKQFIADCATGLPSLGFGRRM